MSALVRLADAAGAVVQSDSREPIVRIRPKCPISPWDWRASPTGATIADDVGGFSSRAVPSTARS